MACLNLGSWNATGIMSSAAYTGSLLDKKSLHFLGISEHWLCPHNLHFIESIHRDYTGFAVCDNDLLLISRRKVGKGGVALLWHRSLNDKVTPLDIDSDRICGLQFRMNDNLFIYILQVYAPCSSHSINTYRDFIDLLHVTISMYSNNGLVLILGDFNAHLQGKRFIKNTDARGRSLLDLMHGLNLLAINTLPNCIGSYFSFRSYGDLYESLIDHILIPSERLDTVLSCEILDDDVLNVSRHLPVVCSVSIPTANLNVQNFDFPAHVKWEKLDDASKTSYRADLEALLLSSCDSTGLSCNDSIDRQYSHIVNSILRASDKLPKTRFKPFLKPYWDSILKHLHAVMRGKRREWIRNGRPRGMQNISYKEYKTAKTLFRAHHRRCAENYLTELNLEIDKAAEIDSAVFWKKVNNRRKTSHTSAGSEINFSGTVCRDPSDIVQGWGQYFSNLYSDTQRDHYDTEFQSGIEESVQRIISNFPISCRNRDTASISTDEVINAVKCLKSKKACGPDKVYNEHLIFGGIPLYEQLSSLFSNMYAHGHVPQSLKYGIIITLHKGGRKSKTDPNCYRAITLSSAILKLFERILLEKVQNTITKQLNWLQGGFRPNIGCNMSSVMLRECILYAKENHSKLYVCYLDVEKAFDRVWHCGLFFKLHEYFGIQSELLRIIIELHTNMRSCVIFKGYTSDWFDILQGTRQGGVLSPFLFLCFTDDLLEELCRCSASLKISNHVIGCPAVCDDLLLASLSKRGLDELMRICFNNSCKWHFSYMPTKCCVIVYNESKYEYIRSNRSWVIGNSPVEEDENYKHLGVISNKYLSLKPNIKDASDKMKSTFFSLMNSGIFYDNSLHPLTCKKIYNAVVIPKALYGCENWFALSSTELLTLERAHRFCIKKMQSLPLYTRSDVALGLLAIFPIEVELDIRKLILFGQFCRLNLNCWVKTLFLYRLTSFNINPNRQTGFIVEIHRLLRKYQLDYILHAYLQDGIFPGKLAWKRLIKSKAHESARLSWFERVSGPEFVRFGALHHDFSPHWLWQFSKDNRKMLKPCISVVQLLSRASSLPFLTTICNHCQKIYVNLLDHCIHECIYLNRPRALLLQEIFYLDVDVYMYLNRQDRQTQTNLLLGVMVPEFLQILSDRSDTFKRICISNLHKLWCIYKAR